MKFVRVNHLNLCFEAVVKAIYQMAVNFIQNGKAKNESIKCNADAICNVYPELNEAKHNNPTKKLRLDS